LDAFVDDVAEEVAEGGGGLSNRLYSLLSFARGDIGGVTLIGGGSSEGEGALLA